ncbi:GNAT family N-acetyltransferase [Sphingomonas sp. BIUV-7]|uniref:GNAT family N-acetyltransferase n=1 Tax=Sphingomonas natans TaxID=3063330 RepID=A0ABT8YFH1_9SPHN|nr:GNAT family N-acetyltransferase [Sphingomonas sp. BIUV-7]MDO6416430.1 GNAT family N-acetyltransferase [Sphingomonas sp. BIUV-7]
MSQTVIVRLARAADADALAAIYGGHVLRGTASFEVDPPDAEEMRLRFSTVTSRGWPWFVAERDGAVIGYAYYSRFHTRHAYRFTCEDSIYVHEDHVGTGAGRALLTALIDHARDSGFREMIAVIGDAANTPSIALHEAFGFEHAGVLRRVGYKFDRWLDILYMQLNLKGDDG